MKKVIFSAIVGITLAFLAFPPSDSHATVIGFPVCSGAVDTEHESGGCLITDEPPDPVSQNPNNNLLIVWDEVQNFELTQDLRVDRVADESASFIVKDGPNNYRILAGTIVSSHYVQWDPNGSGTVTATMEFDSEIFAFITADQKMFDSDEQLGLPELDYNDFGLRGLEGGDRTTIRGNEVDIRWSASSPGDWTRLITAFSPGGVNHAPNAVNDNAVTNKNTPVTISVLDNDSDEDGDEISLFSVTNVPGNISINPDESIIFIPQNDFVGIAVFTYTITDGELQDSATVTVIVNDVNAPPIAVDDVAVTDEDNSVDILVLDNDSDVDSEITIVGYTDPSNGSVTIIGGIVTYTPNENFNGNDSFTYIISDGELESTATVSITVNPVNDAPVCDVPSSSLDSIWPPNHKMKSVTVGLGAIDVDGDELTYAITDVFQDEEVNELGDGDASPDAEITGDNTLNLRAERSGLGDGRIYIVSITASDGELSCSGDVTIGVPHDKKDTAYDSGVRFNSLDGLPDDDTPGI